MNIEKINNKKEELIARLNENKIGKIAYSAVKGMIVDSVISLATGNAIQPVVTVLNTINEIIKQHKGNPIKNEELAYLALMQQRL